MLYIGWIKGVGLLYSSGPNIIIDQREMEEHQALTRLVPIERKIIITNVVKYLLAGVAFRRLLQLNL